MKPEVKAGQYDLLTKAPPTLFIYLFSRKCLSPFKIGVHHLFLDTGK